MEPEASRFIEALMLAPEESREAGREIIMMSATPLLDNPIWSALSTDHAHLALGDELARRYPEEISPLSGMPAPSAAGYEALRPLAGPDGVVGLFLLDRPRPPAGWTLLRDGVLFQMVATRPVTMGAAAPADGELRRLTPADAAAMVELAELTEPGPFRRRTMELGGFLGIFQAGRLLAMAGTRLHLPGYVEVSAVCTHPQARGRGYARMLMSRVIEEILSAGSTPFLHTFATNHGAIRIYESLGFAIRRSFELAVLRRED